MSIKMPDGSIMPSHVYVSNAQANTRNDPYFRIGKVVAVYYPTDTGNYSQTFIEYDVLSDHIDSYGMHTKVVYPRCKVMSLFGGAADFTDWTYRLSNLVGNNQSGSTNGPSQTVDYGSTVCLLCVNGDVRQGIIVGGLKHIGLTDNDNFTPTEDAGTHLNFEFNGVVIQINDSGEFSLTFNGKTDANGDLNSDASSSNSGSNVLFAQDGSITASTPSNDQSINLNNTSKETTITTDSKFTLTSNGNVVVQSAGVLNGAATDAWILGTTFREGQTIMDTQLSTNLATIGSLVNAAAAQLSSAGAVLVLPFVGSIIAGPMITAAGAQLAAAGPLFVEMGTAIDEFEAGNPTDYLSIKNFSD